MLKKTGLPIAFINYAKDATYKSHVFYFSLILLAINLLILVIAWTLASYKANLFTDSESHEVTRYLTTAVVHLGLISLANMLFFIILSSITSVILFKKEPKSNKEITINIEELKRFCQYYENPIDSSKAIDSSHNGLWNWVFIYFLFQFLFWYPQIYVSFKTKNYYEIFAGLPKWNVSEEKKYQSIIYDLSLMANYLWYSHMFFTSEHKLAQVRGWLNIYIREAERHGFVFPTE
ncbi:hypothetical protein ACA758_04770 [Mycoplasmopsis agassizii]|uniref:hypothetical protein n=1 Tax=Mycoplasmopsis agassizii TaxID=33922 RepID=UPI0035294A60